MNSTIPTISANDYTIRFCYKTDLASEDYFVIQKVKGVPTPHRILLVKGFRFPTRKVSVSHEASIARFLAATAKKSTGTSKLPDAPKSKKHETAYKKRSTAPKSKISEPAPVAPETVDEVNSLVAACMAWAPSAEATDYAAQLYELRKLVDAQTMMISELKYENSVLKAKNTHLSEVIPKLTQNPDQAAVFAEQMDSLVASWQDQLAFSNQMEAVNEMVEKDNKILLERGDRYSVAFEYLSETLAIREVNDEGTISRDSPEYSQAVEQRAEIIMVDADPFNRTSTPYQKYQFSKATEFDILQ